jgi:hypothetical protein
MPNLQPYLGGAVIPLIGIVPQRVIDPDARNLVAQVTIDEDGDDEMTITEHPVEQGAAISDHAYKRPAELRVRVGWSDAYVQQNMPAGFGVDQVDAAVGVDQVYEAILYLQSERRPFTVVTGKRQYDNMLIASLRTHTDAKLEFTFVADIIFREILLVNTGTVTAGGAAAASSSSSNLANQEANTTPVQGGTMSTQQVNISDNSLNAAGADQDFSGGETLVPTGASGPGLG